MGQLLKALTALIAGATWTASAYADVDYGTFGAWKVYGDLSAGGPECHMIPSSEQATIPAAFFLVGQQWPASVIVAIVPVDASLGLSDGRHVLEFSEFSTGKHMATKFTVIWKGRGLMAVVPFVDLERMAGLNLQSWRVEVPDAGIDDLMIPLDGFAEAVNALAHCRLETTAG